LSLAEVAQRLAPRRRPSLRGVRLPLDAKALTLAVRVFGDDIVVNASVLTPRSQFVTLALGRTRGRTPTSLRAPLPHGARGGTLVGLRFERVLRVEEHAQGEAPVLRGVLTLGRLGTIRGDSVEPLVDGYDNWIETGSVDAIGAGQRQISYVISQATEAGFRPRQATDERPIAALVSPGVAAAAADDRLFAFRLGSARYEVSAVATASRFPTLEGEFVVVDSDSFFTAANAANPGAANVNEIWIQTRDAADRDAAAAALRRPPFDVLDVRQREPFAERLRTDPLAIGTLVILVAAAGVAALLALVAVLLLIVAETRDERGELFDLEAQGATPAMLRRHLGWRVAIVVAPGIAAGLAAGAALATTVVAFVTVAAGAVDAEPPLLLVLDVGTAAALVCGFIVVLAGASYFAIRRAFAAEPAPTRTP
jgi:hypothetical protein